MKSNFGFFATLTLAAFLFISPKGFAIDDYKPGPDSEFKADVPHGKVTKYVWESSKVFPGTTRTYWVYVPKQYDAAKPAAVMVFQDGDGYVKTNGPFRAP